MEDRRENVASFDFQKIGTPLHFADWNTYLSSVIWMVRWHPNIDKGLVLVKPVIALPRAVGLQGNQGMQLNKA